MRAVFVLPPLLLALSAVPVPTPVAAQSFVMTGETPEQARRREARDIAHEQAMARQYSRHRPSDVAECRSRGNAVFGGITAKERVMNDCLRARELRRQGR